MTAHALREENDSCLVAGMDVVLAKPATIEQIRATVLAYAGRRAHVLARTSAS